MLTVGLAVAMSAVGALFYDPPVASGMTFSNACINSAVPTAAAQLDVTLTADVPASVEPGASFQLTNISQALTLPGAIFVAGYNLGLLVEGQNTVPGTSKTVIEGTNTIEGLQTTPITAVSLTFTINDPDNVPGTGDETGTGPAVAVSYPAQTWTAGPAGAIAFREDTVTPHSSTVGGILITAIMGGIITVRFGCDPGTVGPGGTPADIVLANPAPSFASTISGTIESPFADVPTSHTFYDSIVWAFEQGITTGCSTDPPLFCPNDTVTRGQMATFLDRALDLPPAGQDYFTDDNGTTHEDSINRVRAYGLAFGCTATTFCPNAPLLREQMATFLDRALDPHTTPTDYFTDDETSTHEEAINRIREAEIAFGCTATTFCPKNPVTRGQMTAFLHRALGD
jgi:hypothetical protein